MPPKYVPDPSYKTIVVAAANVVEVAATVGVVHVPLAAVLLPDKLTLELDAIAAAAEFVKAIVPLLTVKTYYSFILERYLYNFCSKSNIGT